MKVIYNDGTVDVCPVEQELEVLRHSAAHIMAQAVKTLPRSYFCIRPCN